MGRELEGRTAPAQLDVGVMTLRFGDQRHPRDEPKRVAEVRKRELAAQGPGAVALPVRDLCGELGGLGLGKGRCAWRTDHAVSRGELAHPASVATSAPHDK